MNSNKKSSDNFLSNNTSTDSTKLNSVFQKNWTLSCEYPTVGNLEGMWDDSYWFFVSYFNAIRCLLSLFPVLIRHERQIFISVCTQFFPSIYQFKATLSSNFRLKFPDVLTYFLCVVVYHNRRSWGMKVGHAALLTDIFKKSVMF